MYTVCRQAHKHECVCVGMYVCAWACVRSGSEKPWSATGTHAAMWNGGRHTCLGPWKCRQLHTPSVPLKRTYVAHACVCMHTKTSATRRIPLLAQIQGKTALPQPGPGWLELRGTQFRQGGDRRGPWFGEVLLPPWPCHPKTGQGRQRLHSFAQALKVTLQWPSPAPPLLRMVWAWAQLLLSL